MSIETLQIKRVTGNWGTHKGELTSPGEPILINANVISGIDYPMFLLGDGTSLEAIVEKNNVFVNMLVITKLITDNNTNNASTSVPTNITNSNGDVGTSTTFARADHTHKLDATTVNTLLGITDAVDTYSYRKIKSGTSDPTKETVKGNKGDIYIKYE